MHLKTRNVNTAFRELVTLFTGKIRTDVRYTGNVPAEIQCIDPVIAKRPSRNGNVLVIDEPVTVTYTHPKERVLFNAARDANPFFHLYEALWMLAGRNDVAPLAYYNKRMAEFSDNGETFNGAYGYRWRKATVAHSEDKRVKRYAYCESGWVDQLDLLVAHLKADPTSRRAVLQMWNVEDDLLKVGGPEFVCKWCGKGRPDGEAVLCRCGGEFSVNLNKASKDVCCNMSVMFSLRGDKNPTYDADGEPLPSLDMTVTNRSNDLIWGCLGGDYVTFSVLQEYVAVRLGCEVGLYHHFTNNLHVYDWNWKPEEWLSEPTYTQEAGRYGNGTPLFPLTKDPGVFERELRNFAGAFSGEEDPWQCVHEWQEPFLMDVAAPLLSAFRQHKQGERKWAMEWAEKIKADDWRIAATRWLERRKK